jgi:hypothetical protein
VIQNILDLYDVIIDIQQYIRDSIVERGIKIRGYIRTSKGQTFSKNSIFLLTEKIITFSFRANLACEMIFKVKGYAKKLPKLRNKILICLPSPPAGFRALPI